MTAATAGGPVTAPPARRLRVARRASTLIILAVLVVQTYPIIWIFLTSLRTPADFAGSNPERGTDAAADRSACLLQFDVGRAMEIELFLNPPPAPAQRPQQQQQRR